jgi:hypothetical protein
MTLEDTIKIAAAILTSLGGAGVIILGLSSWLGKVWANRLMEDDRAKHGRALEELRAVLNQRNQKLLEADRAKYNRELEELRADLVRMNEENINRLKSDLEIQRRTQIQEYQDKLTIYRLVTDIVTELLGDLDNTRLLADLDDLDEKKALPPGLIDRFNRGRMKAYGYLAMLASQEVIDSFDRLMDYLLAVSLREERYNWDRVRAFVIDALNMIRADVGINKSPIEYRGDR